MHDDRVPARVGVVGYRKVVNAIDFHVVNGDRNGWLCVLDREDAVVRRQLKVNHPRRELSPRHSADAATSRHGLS
jgi:hypothetical protein